MSKLTWIDLNERAFERLVNNFMFVFSTSNVGNVMHAAILYFVICTTQRRKEIYTHLLTDH